MTPETTRRVLGAIEDLGFRRNESARLLRTGHTATLGFIADTWADPDHAAVYRGLEQRRAGAAGTCSTPARRTATPSARSGSRSPCAPAGSTG